MKRTIAAAALLLLAGFLAACGGDDDDSAATTTTSTTTTTTASSPPVQVDFAKAADIDLSGGWATTPCGGDAPITCVTRDGEQVGFFELLGYPVDDGSGFADDLRARVEDYYETFEENRSPEHCGEGYEMEPDEPQETSIGDTPALRFGFTAGPDGEVLERHVSWMGVKGDTIWVVGASAYDQGACQSNEGEFTVADLEDFIPVLEPVVEASPLPAGPL